MMISVLLFYLTWFVLIGSSVYVQQGSPLVGTGNSGVFSGQGNAVAVSANGNTTMVGGSLDGGGIGAVWSFIEVSNGEWSQLGPKVIGSNYVGSVVSQGYAVAVSANGNTALIGGYQDNNGLGAAWVFVRNSTGWSQQGSKLVGTGYIGTNVFQGCSVALSADGNTALIGGYGDNSSIGAAWVFVRDSSQQWSQQGAKLVGTNYTGNLVPRQGISVALSGDGNTAAIGGTYDDDYHGSVWIFVRGVSGTWTQQGPKLSGSDSKGVYIYQGSSVALSYDGSTLITGGSQDDDYIGASWVFVRSSSNNWIQQGPKLIGSGYSGTKVSQGTSVGLSADGNTALVGGPRDNNKIGASWIFSRNTSGLWSQYGTKLVGSGGINNGGSGIFQGSSVALSADGTTAVVGGDTNDNQVGATWIFVENGQVNPAPTPPSSGSVAVSLNILITAGFIVIFGSIL